MTLFTLKDDDYDAHPEKMRHMRTILVEQKKLHNALAV